MEPTADQSGIFSAVVNATYVLQGKKHETGVVFWASTDRKEVENYVTTMSLAMAAMGNEIFCLVLSMIIKGEVKIPKAAPRVLGPDGQPLNMNKIVQGVNWRNRINGLR